MSLCTHIPDHSSYNYFSIYIDNPDGPTVFLVRTIHQVIWPSPRVLILQAPLKLTVLVCGLVRDFEIWAFYHTLSAKCQFR